MRQPTTHEPARGRLRVADFCEVEPFGQQLAKGRSERTRHAGLRRRKLRPAALKRDFPFQSSIPHRLPSAALRRDILIRTAACGALACFPKTAGLRVRRLRPADPSREIDNHAHPFLRKHNSRCGPPTSGEVAPHKADGRPQADRKAPSIRRRRPGAKPRCTRDYRA